MNSGTAMTLLKILSSDKFAGVAKGAATGDASALDMLFNAAGHKEYTQKDAQILQQFAALFGNLTDSNDADAPYQTDWTDEKNQERLAKESKAMSNLLLGTPPERAIKLGLAAASSVARMGGDMAANNGNRLAAADRKSVV